MNPLKQKLEVPIFHNDLIKNWLGLDNSPFDDQIIIKYLSD